MWIFLTELLEVRLPDRGGLPDRGCLRCGQAVSRRFMDARGIPFGYRTRRPRSSTVRRGGRIR